MDRKNFLSLTKKAVIASSVGSLFVSQKVFGQDAVEPESVELVYERYEKVDGFSYFYSITMFEKSIDKDAIDKYRKMKLLVTRKIVSESAEEMIASKKEGEYAIDIKKIKDKEVAQENAQLMLDCKIVSLNSGYDVLPEVFTRSFSVVPSTDRSSLEIFNSSGKSVFSLYLVSDDEYDEYEDCFITSACVGALGLADNCYELETLRSFRDSYICTQENGKDVIKNYYTIGPKIVAEINQQNDAKEIYNHIYNTLVLPSLALINQNKNEEAFAFYQNYVYILSETVIG